MKLKFDFRRYLKLKIEMKCQSLYTLQRKTFRDKANWRISNRKCVKWNHNNCTGWSEKALDFLLVQDILKKSSM